MESLTVLNPAELDWAQWSATVADDLRARYTLPNPVSEGLWQLWAAELLNIPGLAAVGLPDPRNYGDDWQAWAAAFMMATT